MSLFLSVILAGISFRWVTSFWGLAAVLLTLLTIYIFAAIHAALRAKVVVSRINTNGALLKFCFTVCFLLITGVLFANRRTLMGFEILRMDVPVMEPALLQGDRFLVDTWKNNVAVARGTIVVHTFQNQPGLYLNRVVAIENDKIEIKNGVVIINGSPLEERYVLSTNKTKKESINMELTMIPAEHYFVMGDNRDASLGDSRFSKSISAEDIIGIATEIIHSKLKARIGLRLK